MGWATRGWRQEAPIRSWSHTPAAAALVAALALAACAAPGTDVDEDRAAPASRQPVALDGDGCTLATDLPGGDVAEAPRDDVLPFPWEASGAERTRVEGFDELDIVSGGPPPDGIRPIEADEACFEDVTAADEDLTEDAAVLVVEVAGDVRAYPLGILTQHEIVNDVVGGVPVVVTYCPLCNSGLAFEREVAGEVLSFGTSGRLFQSNLVMYDRQHHNLWTQFDGLAVVGTIDDDLTGTRLQRLPTSLLGWAEFRELAPDGIVLSADVFPDRDYNVNPYPGYDDIGIGFGLFRGETDERLDANDRVVGLGAEDDPVAVPLEVLRERGVVAVEVDGLPVSVWWAPGAASALDARSVDGGRDVGQTLSVVARADDGTPLAFTPAEDDPTTFVDDATGSRWNLFGEAVSGPLAGTRLEVVPRDDTFWFVWFAFRPQTRIAVGAP